MGLQARLNHDSCKPRPAVAVRCAKGLRVIAEGVEKEGQFNLLRERGCDLAQGYWLGYPVTAAEFAQLIA